MFTPIGRILPESLKKSGLTPHVQRARLFETFIRLADEVLPEPLRGRFRLTQLRQGTLTVACKTAGVARLIQLHEERILEELKRLGGEPVERVRLMLAPWR